MIPSISSSFFLELAPAEALTLIAAAGFPAAEIGSGHAVALGRADQPAAAGRELAAVAADLGLALPQGHLDLDSDIALPEPAARRATLDALRRQLDAFAAIGVKVAVLHPGGNAAFAAGCPDDEIAAGRTAALHELLDHLDGSGMAIALETMYDRPFGATELLRVIEAAGNHPKLGVCMDTGHLNLIGHRPAEFADRVGRLLLATHIADNHGSRDEHLFPYSGYATVDWPATLDALRRNRYAGPFNFESNGERTSPMEVKLAKLAYARQLAEIMLQSAAAAEA